VAPSEKVTSVPPGAPLRVADGIWGAELLNRQSFDQESLTGSGGSLYAFGNGTLNRIDPATGNILQSVPYTATIPNRPVVVGNTVWVVWRYGSGDITLRGYDARTLAQVGSVEVPAIGGVASSAAGALAAGPDGKLYVAAGESIAVVNPSSGQLTRRINLTAGRASSVAVAPDGSTLYVGIGSAGSFRLLIYDAETGRILNLSAMQGGAGGNLIATSGGVWGTAGTGMSEWVWFAPGGDLTRSSRITQGAGGGLASLPNLSGGAVWIGGSHELICASPATGKALARTVIPTDHSVVEYFGSVTVLGNGHAYALYQDERAQLAGVAQLTPPQACTGG
jgi:sugar lactone lactonase YvrE